MRVTAIIPAHNEEARIARVIEAVLATAEIDDVVVVNDGSTDGTVSIVRRYCPQVRLIDLDVNCGKGGAMLHGVRACPEADIVVFLDADLINLNSGHVCALMQPLLAGDADMAVGQFKGGRGLTDLAQLIVPYISGQRAIRRDLFLQIPELDRVGYGIEMAITFHVKHLKRTVRTVMMHGVTHPMKEEKLGLVRGAAARARMYAQMFKFGLGYAIGRKAPRSRESLRRTEPNGRR